MKLTGNKLIACAVFTLATSFAHAESDTVELTTFTAGAVAKASEVNGNFTALKEYIEQLETKINILENNVGDGFNLAVYGDGELIGYTNKLPQLRNSSLIELKTTYGMILLEGVSSTTEYRLRYLNPYSEGWGEAYFLDSACTQPVMAIAGNDGEPMIFTKTDGIVDSTVILPTSSEENPSAYVIEKGTTISNNVSTFYHFDSWDDSCNLDTYLPAGTYSIPLVDLNKTTHGLKASYSNISIEGYVKN